MRALHLWRARYLENYWLSQAQLSCYIAAAGWSAMWPVGSSGGLFGSGEAVWVDVSRLSFGRLPWVPNNVVKFFVNIQQPLWLHRQSVSRSWHWCRSPGVRFRHEEYHYPSWLSALPSRSKTQPVIYRTTALKAQNFFMLSLWPVIVVICSTIAINNLVMETKGRENWKVNGFGLNQWIHVLRRFHFIIIFSDEEERRFLFP